MPKLIQYQLTGDANRKVEGECIPPSKYIDAYVLAAGVAQDIVVPSRARIAIFNSNSNFYVSWTGVAAVAPATNVTDGSGPEMNPAARDVSNYDGFSMIAPDACVVTIAYYV